MTNLPTMRLRIMPVCLAMGLFAFPAVAAPSHEPLVQVIDIVTGEVEEEWNVFSATEDIGVSVDVGDFTGDGVFEYVVAHSGGDDAEGRITTYRMNGTRITTTTIEGVKAGARMSLATGDVDGDGKDEIVVSRPDANTSDVLILDATLRPDTLSNARFIAFPEFTAGATVAAGNVLGDARDEIIVGTGHGVFPLARIFNEKGAMLAPDLSPFDETATQGVTAAAVNTGGGEYDDVVLGQANGAETWIKSYRIDERREYPVLGHFRAWSREYNSGVNIAGVDLGGDGTEEIVVVPAGDQRGEAQFFRGDGEPIDRESIPLFSDDFRGGVDVTIAQLDTDKSLELVVSPQRQYQRGDTERGEKWIEVNLSEQVEYIWEDGYLRNVYLVSTGLAGTATPPGEYSITKKLANHHYVGEDYNFPNTPWNLRFIEGGAGRNYYLHTAYWHNNFGNPMSHGCVNMREEDAGWVFEWADIETPVWVHY